MNEKIEQFNEWYLNAEPNDRYTYYIGSLALEKSKATGIGLRALSDYIMNFCCRWDLVYRSSKPESPEPRFAFKNKIRLFQKVVEKYTATREVITPKTDKRKILCKTEYYAVKI
tara:strand:+ start:205 stop:546 length:342 start_codon:yes stop_codon:yes gene_type:complete